jgi:SpoVK/Ycf46/Vps4 family AAA+-type ATPase
VILAGSLPWQADDSQPGGILSVPFAYPGYKRRKQYWQASLAEQGLAADAAGLEALAERFKLNPGQVQAAAAAARIQGGLFPAGRKRAVRLPEAALFAAARAQSGHQLAALAQKIEPRYGFSDIVLPEDALRQLEEICQRVALRGRVMDEWGFEQKLSLGKGVSALFAGPSGTGKTMAAEIIARELGLDLYRIDLAAVVSKYIGETEKNLSRIFEAAESANAILFFDEADALFGKRSEVHDAHDRYANLEISYLLQKMDQFEGVAVLATNLAQNLDEAFIRRLAFTVHFPLPDEDSRRRIWQGIWPRQTPLDPGLDPGYLAARFKLSGGNIKNIALGAAFLAAREGGRVSLPHLLHAARREYQKIGKVLPESGEEG